MAGEQFSLCWDNFHKNMSSGMHSLLESEDLVDVTLAIEGKYLKAHKMVLSVCSPYFRELFQMNPCKHPIVFMKDVSYTAMSDLLTFMYQGEVQVNQEQLTTFIKTAEALQIKGLTSDGNNDSTEVSEDHTERVTSKTQQPITIDLNDDEVIAKPVQKSKKPTLYPPVKRQRTSSPPRERPSSITALTTDTTRTEQIQQSTEQLIQFKMEPYEADQSDQGQMEGYEENPDDNFGEDGVDDSHIDDSEYSMLKGEEEPQAGTSGDGMGESQVGCNAEDVRKARVYLNTGPKEKGDCRSSNKQEFFFSSIYSSVRKYQGGRQTKLQKLYRCPICDNRFTKKSSLNRHIDTHKGKYFTCSMCDFRFTQKGSLMYHIKNKHNSYLI